MARIIIDARKYFDFGIGTYISHLVDRLAALSSPHTFRLLVSPGDAPNIAPPAGWESETIAYGKYSVSEILLLGRNVRSHGGPFVFHSPHYTLPMGLKNRSVVTIHDLIHLRFPQVFSLAQRAYARGMIGHAVKSARYVITDSEFTRQDILRSFKTSEDKVVAVPLGVSDRFRVLSDSQKEQFRIRNNLSRPYILFVGNPKPHKGIDVLLRSFAAIAPKYPEYDLLFVGGKPPVDVLGGVDATGAAMGARIRSVGHVSDDDLVGYYNCAEMLVLPSLYEGFGLPALEAMACGTCVIVSDAASLPEIVGDAALIFHSNDQTSLAERIKSLLNNTALRRTMIERGKEQARKFPWERTARETLTIYEQVLGG